MDDTQIKEALKDHCDLVELSLPKNSSVHVAIIVSIEVEKGKPVRSLHHSANVDGRELSNLIAGQMTKAINLERPPGE